MILIRKTVGIIKVCVLAAKVSTNMNFVDEKNR